MKGLKDILSEAGDFQYQGSLEKQVSHIQMDSRKVGEYGIFVAVRGTRADGHDYINQAIKNGASVIVGEQIPEAMQEGVTYIRTNNSAKTLGRLTSAFYNHPSRLIKLVGVTGTNGKTTTATLLYRLFKNLGYKTGLLSTVRNFIHDKPLDATHTTPDTIQLNQMMNEMVQQGCDYCFMEVSSHAIDQQRIEGLTFAGGIFSNLTHDHLDYHKTFEAYLRAKKQFFDNLPKQAFSLSNRDDKNGSVMLQNTLSRKHTYSLKTMADFKGKIIESHFDGMQLIFNGQGFWTTFIGEFNAYNLLAVYATAVLLGQKGEEVLQVLSMLHTVPGRFESIRSGQGVTGIVDYAHTPDALLNVLKTINHIRKGEGALITVVGAGGDRDKTKRPVMAKVASELSDKVILTSDNPRSEDPVKILEDMWEGVPLENRRNVLNITHRGEAIKTAVMMAASGDIILVAGKGHETYQEVQGVKHHFDDMEELKQNFNQIT